MASGDAAGVWSTLRWPPLGFRLGSAFAGPWGQRLVPLLLPVPPPASSTLSHPQLTLPSSCPPLNSPGPTALRGMDPRLIAALTDNPELLRALMQRATRRPAAAGSGGEGGSQGEEEEEEEDEEGVQEVSCRVA